MKIINIALVVVLILPSFAFAQTSGYSEQILRGQKTNLTKYPVGACIDNEGGLWQQISDGTWAPPNDVLNTCRTQGMYQDWTHDPASNPWLRAGMDYNYPNFQRPGSYPYGLNYPGPNGGYADYNSWFYNCVITQSFFPRPECQAIPSIGNQTRLNLQINTGKSKGNSFKNTLLAIASGVIISKLFR